MEKKKKDFDKILQEALDNAPSIEGYTIEQLSAIIDRPWTTTRWHIECLKARGVVEAHEFGKAVLYRLKKEKKEKTLEGL